MSGGIAYVLDIRQDFKAKVNMEQVELGTVNDPQEIAELRGLIEDHMHWTGSAHAGRVLKNFNQLLPRFVRVMPLDYKAVLEGQTMKAREEKMRAQMGGFADIKDDNSTLEQTSKTTANTGTEFPAAKHGHSEAPIVDLEDSMVDEKMEKKKAEKLDKTRGFMKYARLSEKYRNVSLLACLRTSIPDCLYSLASAPRIGQSSAPV